MMKYIFDLKDEMAFYRWEEIFRSLALRQFWQFQKYLKFPFDPPKAVQQIGREFSLGCEIFLHGQNSERLSFVNRILENPSEKLLLDLYTPLSSAVSVIEMIQRQQNILHKAFRLLEQHDGYAESLYQWEKGTHYHYSRSIGQVALFKILREWAILDEIYQGSSSKRWRWLIDYYLTAYVGKSSHEYTLQSVNFPFSGDLKNQIKTIFLTHAFLNLRLSRVVDHVGQSPKTLWEDFSFRGGVFYKMEGKHRLDQKALHALHMILTPKQYNLMESWIDEKHFHD